MVDENGDLTHWDHWEMPDPVSECYGDVTTVDQPIALHACTVTPWGTFTAVCGITCTRTKTLSSLRPWRPFCWIRSWCWPQCSHDPGPHRRMT